MFHYLERKREIDVEPAASIDGRSDIFQYVASSIDGVPAIDGVLSRERLCKSDGMDPSIAVNHMVGTVVQATT
ncbi:hypothetical protein L6452_20503 [Arctium lappa]|uniref:Uncharacterized protein n=1 Tax=Arctium lappa TaxID=4217 RepID=A0ACB9BBI8_ARCLA|nr:hypothetical protein L6452_20503 [Arctium lappa]